MLTLFNRFSSRLFALKMFGTETIAVFSPVLFDCVCGKSNKIEAMTI